MKKLLYLLTLLPLVATAQVDTTTVGVLPPNTSSASNVTYRYGLFSGKISPYMYIPALGKYWRMATTQQLQDYQQIPDGLQSVTSITQSGNTITVTDPVWRINKMGYSKPGSTALTITGATTGYKRIDLIVGNTSNGLQVVQGVQDMNTAVEPNIPANTVRIARVDINGNAVTPPTPDLSVYVKKSEIGSAAYTPLTQYMRNYLSYIGNGAPINPPASNYYDVGGLMTFAYVNSGTPTDGTLMSIGGTFQNGGYAVQIQGGYAENSLWFRNRNNDMSTWGTWKQIVPYSALSAVALSGSYNDLGNKPDFALRNGSNATGQWNNSALRWNGQSYTGNFISSPEVLMGYSTADSWGVINQAALRTFIGDYQTKTTSDAAYIRSNYGAAQTANFNIAGTGSATYFIAGSSISSPSILLPRLTTDPTGTGTTSVQVSALPTTDPDIGVRLRTPNNIATNPNGFTDFVFTGNSNKIIFRYKGNTTEQVAYVSDLDNTLPVVLTTNAQLQLGIQYSLNSASQLALTLPSTVGFATDGKKTINITASATGGGKIIVPNGYTVRGLAGTTHSDGTGYIVISQLQQILLKPDVTSNSYTYQVLSGTVTVY